MQTEGALVDAVAAAEVRGWLERNKDENSSGTLRVTVTVIVVADGGVVPDGPKATAIVSVALVLFLSRHIQLFSFHVVHFKRFELRVRCDLYRFLCPVF